VLAPLLVLTALAVRLSSPGPVLYRQRRLGLDGQEFDILKFRTMFDGPQAAEEPDATVAEAMLRQQSPMLSGDRRTPVGRWLRRFSLDELPQLINVLRGEMSLIGPRPERPTLADSFKSHVYRYGDRHRVKSGITGWAQVNGLRGRSSLADRVEWDNYYIENWSPWLDLKILILTIPGLVQGRNAE
ncbi:MAG: sugar transferase, partial [Actinomycetota bacterium]|nr:sugar transferase [Actinomycetota bacterium]